MNQEIVDILRRAGDVLAINLELWESDAMRSLNPYFSADSARHRRVMDWDKVDAVEHLLCLVEHSSGAATATEICEKLRFRYDMHVSSNSPYIWELDEATWLLYADLVCLRAIEQLTT